MGQPPLTDIIEAVTRGISAVMMEDCGMALWVLFFLFLFIGHPLFLSSLPPIITKVEPPHWWVGLPFNPLFVLLWGKNLKGARVETESAFLRTKIVREGQDGRYLLFLLYLAPSTPPRRYRFTVQTPGGKTTFSFALKRFRRTPRRFQGLTKGDIIYLLMPDRFCDGDPSNNDPKGLGTYDRKDPKAYHGGDLKGVIQKLRYLKDLGVTTLWLTPLYDNDDASPEEYHGYHPVDFFAVDEHFGTMGDYRALVQRAHRVGLKVIQDHILNHTGPKHPFLHDPPTPSWFHPQNPIVVPLSVLIDPEAKEGQRRNVVEGWLFGFLPDLNQDDPFVARYLIQHSLWWLAETGADGVRLDTVPYIPRPFLSRWRQAIRRAFPRVTVLGEVFPTPPDPRVIAFFQGGQKGPDGIDTRLECLFDFPMAMAIREVFGQDAPMKRLQEVLEKDDLYPDPSRLVIFLGNHDLPRFITAARPDHRWERMRLATVFLMTIRGIVQWYYGDEIGMEGGDDPDNRRDFPGGFPGDPRNAFHPGGRSLEENKLWETVRALFRLRRKTPAFWDGKMEWLHLGQNVCVYRRVKGRQGWLIILNKSDGVFSWLFSGHRKPKKVWGRATLRRVGRGWQITVSAWDAAIFRFP